MSCGAMTRFQHRVMDKIGIQHKSNPQGSRDLSRVDDLRAVRRGGIAAKGSVDELMVGSTFRGVFEGSTVTPRKIVQIMIELLVPTRDDTVVWTRRVVVVDI